MAEIAAKLAISSGERLLNKVVDKVYDTISGEMSMLLGVREEIRHIIDELKIMSAFLRDAEKKKASDEAAKAWVQQVRELAYAVEDCIDEFSLHLEHRGGRRNYVAAVLRRLAHSLGSLGARHRIASDIERIKIRVEKVSDRRSRYAITNERTSSNDDKSVAQYDPRLAANFVDDSQLIGMDGPRHQLVEWLIDEAKPQLSLVAVVGEGGLGKTTLARKVYESPKVTDGRFTCRAWIAVSQVYHIDGLLKGIIKQVFPPTDEATRDKLTKDLELMRRDQLITKLGEYLGDKRYVISLDDIWKIDAWNSLAVALPENNLRSRIILTTRNNNVAEACRSQISGNIYQHQKLSSEESMDLFCRRMFDSPEHTCLEELKKASQDILKKCDGLPLAIVSIAGVLASKPKKTRHEWKNMLSRIGSELEYNPNLEGMKKILTFSYNDLPYHIKHCYLYLSKFPEDYLIGRKRIQRLWIAEGLVTGRRDMTSEEVAESYFNELVNRFMILPSAFSGNGKVKSFRVHDIMLEVIVSISMEENFISLLGKNSTWVPQDVIRRLSVHAQHKLENMSLPHVKSLSMFGDGTKILISPSLGLLRVLDFDGCDILKNEHLKIVMKFLHLKYLSLTSTRVDKLPKSLGNLRNLETLDFRGANIGMLPEGIIKLQKLRILRGHYFEVPSRMGELRFLQEFGSVLLSSSSKDLVKELGKLNQLRKISVFVPFWMKKDFCDTLEAMSGSLRSLVVQSDFTLDFLNNLSSPPPLLECLTLHGKLETLPSWAYSLTNLVKLRLWYSEFRDDAIKALGTLPNLIQLKMGWNSYVGESLSFDVEGFSCLKVLSLLGPKNLKSLSFEGGGMRHLELLSMTKCYEEKSRRVSVRGITNLPSLREINIERMHREDLDAVNTQVNKHPKHPRPRLIATEIFTWEAVEEEQQERE